jgi:exopolyphosphatase / guanosine-5'-triphosphate,3'-diphosphate pyrophosphatase
MEHRRIALIDLGTNTFHLLIVEVKEEGHFMPLVRKQVPVKLGRGGISKGKIAPDAYQRALFTLAEFKEDLSKHRANEVQAFATSAVRNARNGPDLIQDIYKSTGIRVETISGEREAELIYFGVRSAMQIGRQPALIVDIGGGSVEFIIANDRIIYWKRSFEIGAQRLMDLFLKKDPIPPEEVEALKEHLQRELQPLSEVIPTYGPKTLIGSSGSFETLCYIDALAKGIVFPTESPHTEEELSVADFYAMYHDILHKEREERLAIPGMLEMRVDMIVVACILIDFLLQSYGLKQIRISYFSLKEGMLHQLVG